MPLAAVADPAAIPGRGPDSPPGRLAHATVMAGLKQALTGLHAVMPPGAPVVYIDYPIHLNVGDLLINLGTDLFLADHGYQVRGIFSIHDFCRTHRPGRPLVHFKDSVAELDRLLAGGTLLVCHGGGNLGDLYGNHQFFREILVDRYPGNRIILLPQSVHFADDAERHRAAAIFGRHPDLHIAVRDPESLAFVEQDCRCPALLLPDMAHQLWDSGRLRFAPAGSGGIVDMRRRDKERRAGDTGAASFDWDDLTTPLDTLLVRATAKWQSIDNPLRPVLPNHRLWYAYRDHIIRRALRRLEPASTIATDRLHGMILGALMSRNVIAADNSYGKLSRYWRQWLAASDRIEAGGAPPGTAPDPVPGASR